MKTVVFTAGLLLFVNLSFAQLNPFAVVGAGRTAWENIKDKKKAKNIQNSISEVQINGYPLSILRVPEDKILSNGKTFILRLQSRLEGYRLLYDRGQDIDVPHSDNLLYDIKALDPEWPVSYYESEIREYQQYSNRLIEKQRHYKYSLQATSRASIQRERDSLLAARKKLEDSLIYEERTRGFHFINKEFALLKEGPSDKSQTVGKLYLGSYVKVLGFSESTGYLKVSLQDVEGFIRQAEVSGSLDELAASEAELKVFRSRQYYRYEPNYDYQASVQKASSLYLSSPQVSSGKSSARSNGRTK